MSDLDRLNRTRRVLHGCERALAKTIEECSAIDRADLAEEVAAAHRTFRRALARATADLTSAQNRLEKQIRFRQVKR